jgi:predicted amidophosphoribosyltransferase
MNEQANYCSQCGAKTSPEAKFCSSCGSALDGSVIFLGGISIFVIWSVPIILRRSSALRNASFEWD